MANSTSISKFKERVMDAITHDDTIFYAFDAKDCENGGDLIDKDYILTYNKIPETVTTVSRLWYIRKPGTETKLLLLQLLNFIFIRILNI